ncbi:MAG: metal-dependent hydrolase [Chloroflexi bacterium]|nr:metal-dependent hydrolase [Chloroflexota bacterium]
MPTILTWLGHAAFLIECSGKAVLVDPYLDDNPSASLRADQVTPDYILVSHGHGDHLGDTLAIARRTGALVVSNHEIVAWLKNQQVAGHAMHIGGGHRFPFGHLKLTPALHGSMLPDGSGGGHAAGFLLTTADGKKIYLAADTGLFGDMRLIGEEGIDLAALPIGDNYTMGPEDALRAVKLIAPRLVLPIHYNTFDLIKQDAQAWAARVESETGVPVRVLSPGQSLQI